MRRVGSGSVAPLFTRIAPLSLDHLRLRGVALARGSKRRSLATRRNLLEGLEVAGVRPLEVCARLSPKQDDLDFGVVALGRLLPKALGESTLAFALGKLANGVAKLALAAVIHD